MILFPSIHTQAEKSVTFIPFGLGEDGPFDGAIRVFISAHDVFVVLQNLELFIALWSWPLLLITGLNAHGAERCAWQAALLLLLLFRSVSNTENTEKDSKGDR